MKLFIAFLFIFWNSVSAMADEAAPPEAPADRQSAVEVTSDFLRFGLSGIYASDSVSNTYAGSASWKPEYMRLNKIVLGFETSVGIYKEITHGNAMVGTAELTARYLFTDSLSASFLFGIQNIPIANYGQGGIFGLEADKSLKINKLDIIKSVYIKIQQASYDKTLTESSLGVTIGI